MSLNVTVHGGTNAGVRKPYSTGHGPKCCCTRCEKEHSDDRPKP